MSTSKRIIRLFDIAGNEDYIGESISILQHCLQAAYIASVKTDNKDPELIISALLHDIGHVSGLEAGQSIQMDGCGILNHEWYGGEIARILGFSDRVSKLIRSHVMGKRYLCWKDPSYHNNLSEASRTTLRFQGGPLSDEEALAFENDFDFESIKLLRRIDEEAKDPNAIVPSLQSYAELLDLHSTFKAPIANYPSYHVTPNQLDFWEENSYLIVKNLSSYVNIKENGISDWVDDISQWPKTENKWLMHHELVQDFENPNNLIRKICRTENFVNFHPMMNEFCRGVVQNIVSSLFKEDAVLFKEKINYKNSGGAGFSAHQDTPGNYVIKKSL